MSSLTRGPDQREIGSGSGLANRRWCSNYMSPYASQISNMTRQSTRHSVRRKPGGGVVHVAAFLTWTAVIVAPVHYNKSILVNMANVVRCTLHD